MKRFILTYQGENIFKDKRSFKTEEYAKTKQASFREWETTFNKRCDVEIQEIEVETKEEILEKEIQLLRALVVEARPWVDMVDSYLIPNSEWEKIDEWLNKTEKIKVD